MSGLDALDSELAKNALILSLSKDKKRQNEFFE
jgi:hypothetical protein